MSVYNYNLPVLLAFKALLLFSLLIAVACETDVERKYVVGIINPSKGLAEVVKGFKEGMEQNGYREGENIAYIYNGPLNGIEKVDGEIDTMLAGKVDLIYTLTTPATRKLKKALEGGSVPGVFGPVFDPVSSGIVESMARPGGQLTGVKVRGSTAKALEWLLALVPDVRRIFIPFHITDKAASQTVEDLQDAALKLNIELVTEDVNNSEDIAEAMDKVPSDADAVWLTCSHLLMSNVDTITTAAMERGIPAASSTHSHRRSPVLVSYGENDLQLGRQVSRLADKLLKGVAPGDIPVENAEYVLVINLAAADSLGIKVPNTVLKQADYIIR